MNQNDFLDTVGYFLDYHHWVEALRLLEFQLEMKDSNNSKKKKKKEKKNKHFNNLEMFYYEKLQKSFGKLRGKKYFENRIANNLFYGLSKEFAVVLYTIPKSKLGLRQYKFMTCPLRTLYYAIGLYLLELSQEYLCQHYKNKKLYKHIHANYGGNLHLENLYSENQELNLNKPDNAFYKPHYDEFCDQLEEEIKDNTARKVVIKLDIENYFDELSIPKLLELLERHVKPSIRKKMRYDAKTQDQLVSFFDFVMGGTSGIPQSDNNIISDFIGYLFLAFGDLFLDDELDKYSDSVDNYVIIRYVDDIYISITFKEQDIDSADKFLNSLAPCISDCLYENLGLRLNSNKTRLYRLNNEDDKEALEKNLKKVSPGLETADKKNKQSPTDKLGKIFDELKQLKCSISPYFQEPLELNQEVLKEVYDKKVQDLLKKAVNQSLLKEIFMGSVNFDFELVNAYPSPIIILILAHNDVSKAFKDFFLSRKDLTSRDIYLILSYLCQTEFNEKKLCNLLKQSPQMKEVMAIFERSSLSPKLPGYYGLIAKQILKIAKPNVIEQIRLRVLCEQKEEYSVALNHLLNEIHAICFVFDKSAKNPSEYKEPKVMEFLKNQKVPHETHAQIRNLFDRRNKSPVSHADPIAWGVTKDEYMHYHSHVGDCLKYLGKSCSLESS